MSNSLPAEQCCDKLCHKFKLSPACEEPPFPSFASFASAWHRQADAKAPVKPGFAVLASPGAADEGRYVCTKCSLLLPQLTGVYRLDYGVVKGRCMS